jgi:hypothetical protein
MFFNVTNNNSFIDFIGAKLMIESGDSRGKFFFYQRISLAIQRGNPASILGTLPYVTPLEEVHCLYFICIGTFNYYLFIKFYYLTLIIFGNCSL